MMKHPQCMDTRDTNRVCFQIFGHDGPYLRSLAFMDNSPIAPVFDLGMQQLRQAGVLLANSQKWIGRDLTSTTDMMGTMALGIGQVQVPPHTFSSSTLTLPFMGLNQNYTCTVHRYF